DANGSGHGEGSAVVTVNVVAAPSITASSATLGAPVTLTATPGYTSYQWYRNGTLISGATSNPLSIASLSEEQLGAYTVTGMRDGCMSRHSAIFELSAASDEGIIAVIGATAGAGGSHFRTTLQLMNAGDQLLSGTIEWKPAGSLTD